MRHAEAAPIGGTVRSDADRPLTSRGEEDAIAMGRTLGRLDQDIGTVLTSTLIRAKRTGECLVGAMNGSPDVRVTPLMNPGFDHEMLLEEATLAAGNVVVVGHQPDVGMLVSYLTADPTRRVFAMPPGSVVALHRETERIPFHIEWCLTPEVLRATAEISTAGVHR